MLKLLSGILAFLNVIWARNISWAKSFAAMLSQVRFKIKMESFYTEIFVKIIIKLLQGSYLWCTCKRETITKKLKEDIVKDFNKVYLYLEFYNKLSS